MRSLQHINANPLPKKEIIALAQAEAKEMVEAGHTDILPVYINAKRVTEYLAAFTKEVQEHATNAAAAYGEKSFGLHGAKIEIAEVGITYDYSNDEEWRTMSRIIAEVREKQKERETFLRSLKAPLTTVDDLGEAMQVQPPVRRSSTSLKVTL